MVNLSGCMYIMINIDRQMHGACTVYILDFENRTIPRYKNGDKRSCKYGNG